MRGRHGFSRTSPVRTRGIRDSEAVLRAGLVLLLAVLFALGLAGATHASTGGPTWVVPLGFGAGERVYWGLDSQSEAEPGSDPRIFYFDLRAREPGTAHLVPWSQPETPDGRFWSRREAFVRALRPLKEEYRPQLLRGPIVAGLDSIRTWDGSVLPRYRLRLFPLSDDARVPVDVLDSTAVAVARVLAIPGRPERLIVIAFVGDPFESTYETQWPVLERRGFTPPPVEWNPPTR